MGESTPELHQTSTNDRPTISPRSLSERCDAGQSPYKFTGCDVTHNNTLLQTVETDQALFHKTVLTMTQSSSIDIWEANRLTLCFINGDKTFIIS